MPDNTPVIGFVAAHRNMGKTTLIEKLIHHLQQQQLRIAVIKHTHHDIEIDQPGKDSYRFREAGAEQVLISSRQHWALITEAHQDTDPSLESLLGKIDDTALDLVFFEGFKAAAFPKIEVHRSSTAVPLCSTDPHIVAVASDDKARYKDCGLTVFDLNAVEDIADFILRYCRIKTPS